jgi:hypothetical protein
MITLFCLLQGDLFDKAFIIQLMKRDSIAAAKLSIIKSRKHPLNDIDVTELMLYSVSVPNGNVSALKQASRLIDGGENEALDPFAIVGEIFAHHAVNSLHVIFKIRSKSSAHSYYTPLPTACSFPLPPHLQMLIYSVCIHF